jgi:Na+/H+ antiporter NhaD/arsenite permease-like protein
MFSKVASVLVLSVTLMIGMAWPDMALGQNVETPPAAGQTTEAAVGAPPSVETPAAVPTDAHSPAGSAAHAADHSGDAAHGEEHHGVPNVAWYWMIPFALLLGSIATMPLINMHFWEHNYKWFSYILGAIVAVYYMFIFDDAAAPSAWIHEMMEYVSFIALLGSLYMVSGGIVINVTHKATPLANTILLAVGAIIANIFGTTGAAMLLIRPYIRMNRGHIKPYHIVFFIFAVANCGGCLTPIGDPPLFMGYLKGVPFMYTLYNLWPMWLVVNAAILVIFFIIDKLDHKKVERHHEKDAGPGVQIFGFHNFAFIALVLFAVFRPSVFAVAGENPAMIPLSREVLMLIAALGSKLVTKPYIYQRNEFTYGPIKEVAILFIGIFSTMVPALNYLNNNSETMPLKTPGQYYFVTGTLSAVLDNAPTYLVFLETKRGNIDKKHAHELHIIRQLVDARTPGQNITEADIKAVVSKELKPEPGESPEAFNEHIDVATKEIYGAIEMLRTYYPKQLDAHQISDSMINLAFLIGHPLMGMYIMAISIGAVFFGAMTYIGNGPNFMVKSIAESGGIRMPSFFGYILRYSLPILLPVYLLVWLLFFVLQIGV